MKLKQIIEHVGIGVQPKLSARARRIAYQDRRREEESVADPIEQDATIQYVLDIIEKMKITENANEDQSVADEVYYQQQQNIGYNTALNDLREKLLGK
jgi:hypothetical protein